VGAVPLLVTAALALGCLAWLAMASAAVRILRRLPVLGELSPPAPSRWPALSVVVPACDEEAGLAAASASTSTTCSAG
jgi:hypothetical protein